MTFSGCRDLLCTCSDWLTDWLLHEFFVINSRYCRWVFRGNLGIGGQFLEVSRTYFLCNKIGVHNFNSFCFSPHLCPDLTLGFVRCKSPKTKVYFLEMRSNSLIPWIKIGVSKLFFFIFAHKFKIFFRRPHENSDLITRVLEMVKVKRLPFYTPERLIPECFNHHNVSNFIRYFKQQKTKNISYGRHSFILLYFKWYNIISQTELFHIIKTICFTIECNMFGAGRSSTDESGNKYKTTIVSP